VWLSAATDCGGGAIVGGAVAGGVIAGGASDGCVILGCNIARGAVAGGAFDVDAGAIACSSIAGVVSATAAVDEVLQSAVGREVAALVKVFWPPWLFAASAAAFVASGLYQEGDAPLCLSFSIVS
jgi:hypothetical protein